MIRIIKMKKIVTFIVFLVFIANISIYATTYNSDNNTSTTNVDTKFKLEYIDFNQMMALEDELDNEFGGYDEYDDTTITGSLPLFGTLSLVDENDIDLIQNVQKIELVVSRNNIVVSTTTDFYYYDDTKIDFYFNDIENIVSGESYNIIVTYIDENNDTATSYLSYEADMYTVSALSDTILVNVNNGLGIITISIVDGKNIGDVNSDGYINSTDAAMTLDLYKNNESISGITLLISDINKDDIINSTDAAMILDKFKNS